MQQKQCSGYGPPKSPHKNIAQDMPPPKVTENNVHDMGPLEVKTQNTVLDIGLVLQYSNVTISQYIHNAHKSFLVAF